MSKGLIYRKKPAAHPLKISSFEVAAAQGLSNSGI